MKYTVVIERTDRNFAAYVPDLPGCVATAPSRAEVERAIREAVAFHLDGLKAEGQPIPVPGTWTVEVEAS